MNMITSSTPATASFPRAGLLALASAVGLAAAGPAAAFCPESPEDAIRGILVTYDDGTTMASRLLPNGLQEDIETYNDGSDEAYFTLGKASVFMVEETPIFAGERVEDESWRFSYPDGIAALPDIEPGMKWEGTVIQTESDGTETIWKMSVSAGALVSVNHAGCRLGVIPIVGRAVDPDGLTDYLGFEFIPSVGLSLFRSYSDTPTANDIQEIVAFGPYPNP